MEVTDGLRLATWDLGGSGQPLLVVHATGFHARAYRALASELADRFHVVGIDLRGHGRSEAPPLDRAGDGSVPALAWERLAADVLDVVAALGLDRPFAFGHSCGGATLLLAEAFEPGTFAALHAYEPVLFDPAAPRAASGLAAGARRRRSQFPSLEVAFEHYRSKPPLAGFRPDVLWEYVEGGFGPSAGPGGDGVELRCPPAVEAATFEMARRSTTWDRLPEVGCPVRLSCGGPSGEFRLPLMEAAAERLPLAAATELAHLSHFGPFERPEDVATLI